MLKHLPEKFLPNPEEVLPTSERMRRVEGTLMLAAGMLGLSLAAGLLTGWIPANALGEVFFEEGSATLTFLAAAWVALWVGYVLWRSRGIEEGWDEEGRRWIWGWAVAGQVLVGLAFLVLVAGLFVRGVFG